jgi:hypothetical protein
MIIEKKINDAARYALLHTEALNKECQKLEIRSSCTIIVGKPHGYP